MLLLQQTRADDVVARWGGEEFVLLLPHSSLDGAMKVSEKLRTAIAVHPFHHGRCTASIGIAIHEHQESLHETVKRADMAMYQAKQSGKNRVISLTLQPA